MTSRRSPSPAIVDRASKTALAVLASVWIADCLGGGSARPDVVMLVLVRLAAIVGIVVVLLVIPPDRLRLQRPLLLFAGLAAILISVQLVPLPSSIWTALPGREPYARLNEIDAVGAVWRPITLSPDLTWNSLVALIPPLVFVLAVPALGSRERQWLFTGLWVTILLSGLLGLLQIAGGPNSALRLYPVNNSDSAIGFFANRNHQAVFLAMGIPLSAWWASSGADSPRKRRARWLIAASAILFLLTAAVATQSRMGAVAVLLALMLAGAFVVRSAGFQRRLVFVMMGLALASGGLIATVLATWADTRDFSAIEQDLRVRVLPETLDAGRTFFPVGAGWGSVAQVYPRFESDADLSPQYLNHTHNELTQILIEGGLSAVLLLLLFLGWYAFALWKCWVGPEGRGVSEARIASILMMLPLMASITDYPLRTPLMASAFAAAAAMMAIYLRGASRRS